MESSPLLGGPPRRGTQRRAALLVGTGALACAAICVVVGTGRRTVDLVSVDHLKSAAPSAAGGFFKDLKDKAQEATLSKDELAKVGFWLLTPITRVLGRDLCWGSHPLTPFLRKLFSGGGGGEREKNSFALVPRTLIWSQPAVSVALKCFALPLLDDPALADCKGVLQTSVPLTSRHRREYPRTCSLPWTSLSTPVTTFTPTRAVGAIPRFISLSCVRSWRDRGHILSVAFIVRLMMMMLLLLPCRFL